MKLIFLLFAALSLRATEYVSETTLLLDAGKPLNICTFETDPTCVSPFKFNIPVKTAGHRVKVWAALIPAVAVPLRSSSNACPDPCQMIIRRQNGVQYYGYEEVDSGGSALSPPIYGSQSSHWAMVEPAMAAAGAWTLPVEVIGQDFFVKRMQFATGSATTSILLYMRVNDHNYNGWGAPSQAQGVHSPYDGKISVQVCKGTTTGVCTAWLSVNNTTSTCIDESKWFGIDFAHCISGPADTIEITVPIPDGSITANSTNNIAFRFNGTEGVTSGYRVLDWALVDNSTLAQLSQIAVTTNVATATATSGTQPFSTGNDVLVYQAPGVHGRFNGRRHITGTATATFTFAPCGSGLGFYMISGACTSPNGTYITPVTNAPAPAIALAPQLAQPTMWAVRIVGPLTSTISWADPSTFVAPGGGNASTGHTLFTTANSLLNANLPQFGYKLKVACADCHAGNASLTSGMKDEGTDLANFNYSNSAIIERSLFHGLTWQNALDIAAWIRSITSIHTATQARPWNPPYSPGPNLDSVPLNEWYAGCGIDCQTMYDNDTREYLCPTGNCGTDWDPTSLTGINLRQIPMYQQMLSWNHWLPQLHPQDASPNASPMFFSSTAYSDYTTLTTNLAPNTFAALNTNYNLLTQNLKLDLGVLAMFPLGWANLNQISYPGITKGCGVGCIPPSNQMQIAQSTYSWLMTKVNFEFHPAFDGMCDQVYTTTLGYGARSSGSYQTRCWPPGNRISFDFAYHINQGGDRTPFAECEGFISFTPSGCWNYNAASVYSWSAVVNQGNYHMTNGGILDNGYYPLFNNANNNFRPGEWYNSLLPMVVVANAAHDLTPAQGSIQFYPFYAFYDLTSVQNNGRQQVFSTNQDRIDIMTAWIHTLAQLTTLYSTAQWQAGLSPAQQLHCDTSAGAWQGNNPPDACSGLSIILPIAKYYIGSTTADMNTLVTWGNAVWDGASGRDSHNFTTDLASSVAICTLNGTGGLTLAKPSNAGGC